MTENDNALLREIHKLVKENNKKIIKLERDARRVRIWKTIRIAFIVALLFGAYYIVQPLLENLTNAYSSIQNSFEEIQQTKESFLNIGSSFNSLKKTPE